MKTFIKKKLFGSNLMIVGKNADKFPDDGESSLKLKLERMKLVDELRKGKKYFQISHLATFPCQAALTTWNSLLKYNPNNLGLWATKNKLKKKLWGTQIFERELIFKMLDLYNAEKKEFEGYATSGGTEGNIFLTWLGVKKMENFGIKRKSIVLVKSSLTHYSLRKAADIVGIRTVDTPLNSQTWGIDLLGLEKTIKSLREVGVVAYILPLTLGYTTTGTSDDYLEICKLVRKLKKRFKGTRFFIWIDAALNGLIEPFLKDSFRPLALPEIQGFITDFHKFGFTPIPTGIVLYRNELRKYIEKEIDYLSEKDNTLLGSRSGICPTAAWFVIHSLGRKGFKSIIDKNKKEMIKFIDEYGKIYRDKLRFIHSENSLNCGIVKEREGFTPSLLINRFGLKFRPMAIKFEDGNRKFEIAKVFFLNYANIN